MQQLQSYEQLGITLDRHNGVTVLRDDLLIGGTKARFIKNLIPPGADNLVYASPAYGGFQIALAAVCKQLGRQAFIFVAKRNQPHANTLRAKALGARIMQVEHGYLSHVEYQATKFAVMHDNVFKIRFGADYPKAIDAIAHTMHQITKAMGGEPKHIWCALGSGTLAKGIIAGTSSAIVHAVQVGKPATFNYTRLKKYTYPKPFSSATKYPVPFPSCSNYDAKAWEVMQQNLSTEGQSLFWNVLA